jgi:hypothetical protein
VLKSAGTDAICAVFVFLHLLKRDAERVAETALAHLQHEAAHADADADVFVGWLGRFAHVDPSDRKEAKWYHEHDRHHSLHGRTSAGRSSRDHSGGCHYRRCSRYGRPPTHGPQALIPNSSLWGHLPVPWPDRLQKGIRLSDRQCLGNPASAPHEE